MLEVLSKKELLHGLKQIKEKGWIENYRRGNDGSIGNLIEDLLGIPENNLAIANSGEWEIKTKRKRSNSLVTLAHNEPSPRKAYLVSRLFLPMYGWEHKEAGKKHPEDEMSFRQTIRCGSYSDRGFSVKIDREQEKITIDFQASKVGEHHQEWLDSVEQRIGLGNLDPVPYWGFRDLGSHIASKLVNCFFIYADTKREKKKEFVWFNEIKMLSTFSMSKFIDALEEGLIYIDFDARTRHNHGTKFRIREANIGDLYEEVTMI